MERINNGVDPSVDKESGEEQAKIFTEYKKLSEMTAKDEYDYQKLSHAGDGFLPLQWEMQEENVILTYPIEGLQSFREIRKEDRVTVLNFLIQLRKMEKARDRYYFSLQPANLYYNQNGEWFVCSRDLASRDGDDFIRQYKALIGCVLTGKYTFAEYMDGGELLFRKEKETEALFDAVDLDAIEEMLIRLRDRELSQVRDNTRVVRKGRYRAMTVLLGVLGAATIGLGVYSGILHFKTLPYYEAVTAGNNAYIENDSTKLIESLESLEVGDMEKHQKVILANAYLQSESLTVEQKQNIAPKLTLTANVKMLNYWIYLGRLDVEQAEDLALQLSDDELLLYAYMKDKELVELDTELTGEEKESKLSDLDSKIQAIGEKYELDETQTESIASEGEPEQTESVSSEGEQAQS